MLNGASQTQPLPTRTFGAFNARGEFRLLRWFAVTGAAAIGVFSVSIALLLGWFIESQLLERDAAISRDFVQSIVNTQRVAAVFHAGAASRNPDFVEFFAHLAAMPDVLRANVYTPDRQ